MTRKLALLVSALIILLALAPVAYFASNRAAYLNYFYSDWQPAHLGQLVQSPAHRIESKQLPGVVPVRDLPQEFGLWTEDQRTAFLKTSYWRHRRVRTQNWAWMPGPDELIEPISPAEWDTLARGE